jgi:hypothetical protein
MAFSLPVAETVDQPSSGFKSFELIAKLSGQLIYDVQLTQGGTMGRQMRRLQAFARGPACPP